MYLYGRRSTFPGTQYRFCVVDRGSLPRANNQIRPRAGVEWTSFFSFGAFGKRFSHLCNRTGFGLELRRGQSVYHPGAALPFRFASLSSSVDEDSALMRTEVATDDCSHTRTVGRVG